MFPFGAAEMRISWVRLDLRVNPRGHDPPGGAGAIMNAINAALGVLLLSCS
jgi:hypothetical protein